MILKKLLLTSNPVCKNIPKHTFMIRMMSSEQPQPDVILENVNDKGIIILNRPKALNALNTSMVEKIYAALKQWENEKTLVLIKGAGEKAFCAGGDVRAVVEAGRKGNVKLGHDFFRKEYATNGLIGNYQKPYIAFIDGIVMGGGVGLSVHGQYRVATERTLFAMPETQIGLFPDVGGSYFLPRLNGKLGCFLALTGYRLKGADVYKAGIATHYTESKNLPNVQQDLMNCNNKEDIEAVLKKHSVDTPGDFSLAPVMSKINDCFGAATVEEIFKNLESDGSDWAKNTLEILKKMCPTSLKVSFKELVEGQSLDLNQCLQMEYRLAVKSLAHTEFYEGVRALLIDKDQKPSWKPATLQEVPAGLVDSYFDKLPENMELLHKL